MRQKLSRLTNPFVTYNMWSWLRDILICLQNCWLNGSSAKYSSIVRKAFAICCLHFAFYIDRWLNTDVGTIELINRSISLLYLHTALLNAVSRYPAAEKCFQKTRYLSVSNSQENFHEISHLILLRLVDLCLEMSSDFKHYFGSAVKESIAHFEFLTAEYLVFEK